MVKIATTKAHRKLFFNLRSNKPTLNALSPSEIDHLAKALDVRQEDVREMEKGLSGGDVLWLHTISRCLSNHHD